MEVLIDKELLLKYPDNFELMSIQEMNENEGNSDSKRWAVRDVENHTVLEILWHDSNPILAAIAKPRDIVRATAKKLSRLLSENDYRFITMADIVVCGQKASRIVYEYIGNSGPRYGEVVAIKKGKRCYTVYFYAQKDKRLETHKLFINVLNSMKFIRHEDDPSL